MPSRIVPVDPTDTKFSLELFSMVTRLTDWPEAPVTVSGTAAELPVTMPRVLPLKVRLASPWIASAPVTVQTVLSVDPVSVAPEPDVDNWIPDADRPVPAMAETKLSMVTLLDGSPASFSSLKARKSPEATESVGRAWTSTTSTFWMVISPPRPWWLSACR